MVSASLLHYVESQLQAGTSVSTIKRASLGAGWKPEDVEAAIAAAKGNVRSEKPKEKAKNEAAKETPKEEKEEPVKEEKETHTAGPGHFQPFTELLTRPVDAIVAAKNKNWVGSILILLVSLLLLGGAIAMKVTSITSLPLIGSMLSSAGALSALLFALVEIITVLAGFVMVSFFAFLKKVIINLLGGKGSFYGAFTAISYGTYVPAIGMIIAAALGVGLGIIGDAVGAIVFFVTLIIGIGTCVRAFMELFEVQLLVPIVASVTILMAIYLALSAILLFMLPSMISGLLSTLGTSNLLGGLGSSLFGSV